VLGFRITRDERAADVPYLGLERGRIRISAVARPEPVERVPRRPPTGVEIVLEVVDVEAERDRVRRAGWPIAEDIASQPWGLRDFRLLDPSGYYVRLTGR
jgi:lactoylglutathione lyase